MVVCAGAIFKKWFRKSFLKPFWKSSESPPRAPIQMTSKIFRKPFQKRLPKRLPNFPCKSSIKKCLKRRFVQVPFSKINFGSPFGSRFGSHLNRHPVVQAQRMKPKWETGNQVHDESYDPRYLMSLVHLVSLLPQKGTHNIGPPIWQTLLCPARAQQQVSDKWVLIGLNLPWYNDKLTDAPVFRV